MEKETPNLTWLQQVSCLKFVVFRIQPFQSQQVDYSYAAVIISSWAVHLIISVCSQTDYIV